MNAGTTSNYSSRFFKADQRGQVNREGYKSFSTFNYGDYNAESRQPFGAVEFVNDVSMGPGNAVYFNRNESIQDVILPITGSLTYRNFLGKKETIHPEHIAFLDPGTDHACEIQNNYEDNWIGYLHIGLKRSNAIPQKEALIHPINFTSTNMLATLSTDTLLSQSFGYAGVYKGRAKSSYELKQAGNGLFVYVIHGAFEVEDRLMEMRDGLALWDKPAAEFEALSDNALLLLFEVPITQ